MLIVAEGECVELTELHQIGCRCVCRGDFAVVFVLFFPIVIGFGCVDAR